MKNTKAIFLIVLGSFLIATGFAFASGSFDQLQAAGGGASMDGARAATGSAPALEAKLDSFDRGAAASPGTPPPPAPTAKDQAKKYVKEHMDKIAMAGIGAYIGFALWGGPAGMLLGAFLLLGIHYMGAL